MTFIYMGLSVGGYLQKIDNFVLPRDYVAV